MRLTSNASLMISCLVDSSDNSGDDSGLYTFTLFHVCVDKLHPYESCSFVVILADSSCPETIPPAVTRVQLDYCGHGRVSI